MKKLPILLILSAMISSPGCEDKKVTESNPLLSEWDTPFGVPPFDVIQPEHYMPAFEEGMCRHNAEVDSIINDDSTPGFDNVILRWDNSGQLLGTVQRVFGTVSGADRNDKLQKIKEEITPILSRHFDDLILNEKLFEKISEVYANRHSLGMDSMQTRLTEKIYKRFVRSGAALSADDRAKLKGINSQIASLQVSFGNNVFGENKRYALVVDSTGIDGLPKPVVEEAARTAVSLGYSDKFVFQLNKPSMIPFLTFSNSRDLRQELYTAYLEKCNHGDEFDNKGNINEIVRLRGERARLLGYQTHADYKLEDRMAANPQNVYSLLDELWTPALERAKGELEEMKAIKLAETGNDDFESWDWWFYAQKLSVQKYKFDEEQVKPYLSMHIVRDGAFNLANRLYGTTFRPIIVPVYHNDCQVFEVLDADNSHLGVLYLDYYTRESKRQGAWCGNIRSQTYRDTEKVYPITSIVCNFPKPVKRVPSLLSIDDALTFFHEFGHALNNLFADVPYSGLYGYEWDMVELPSQIMENWALDPQFLATYAEHYRDGSMISESLIRKIQDSRLFNQGFSTVEYLAAAYIDMDIYTIKDFESIDVNGFEIDMLNNKRGLIEQIAPRYHYPYFLHIMDGGYDVGYYGYIWAEVMDKDAFSYFEQSGDLFNPQIARSFRENVLSKRGTVDGMEQYKAFRGAEPSRLPLLLSRGLISEAEAKAAAGVVEEEAVRPAADSAGVNSTNTGGRKMNLF